jgi:hypothetical protein
VDYLDWMHAGYGSAILLIDSDRLTSDVNATGLKTIISSLLTAPFVFGFWSAAATTQSFDGAALLRSRSLLSQTPDT